LRPRLAHQRELYSRDPEPQLSFSPTEPILFTTDGFELYDLTLDPREAPNLVHASHADDGSRALQQMILGLLIEQLAAKRLTPSA
jgi:hypothetical protein